MRRFSSFIKPLNKRAKTTDKNEAIPKYILLNLSSVIVALI